MSETVDRIVLEESWKSALHSEFDASYMRKLREFLVSESQSGENYLPKGFSDISCFRSLSITRT